MFPFRGTAVVLPLVNVFDCDSPYDFLRARAIVQRDTGERVHFVFIRDANMLSGHIRVHRNQAILDTSPDLYDMQTGQIADSNIEFMRKGIQANQQVVHIHLCALHRLHSRPRVR